MAKPRNRTDGITIPDLLDVKQTYTFLPTTPQNLQNVQHLMHRLVTPKENRYPRSYAGLARFAILSPETENVHDALRALTLSDGVMDEILSAEERLANRVEDALDDDGHLGSLDVSKLLNAGRSTLHNWREFDKANVGEKVVRGRPYLYVTPQTFYDACHWERPDGIDLPPPQVYPPLSDL